MQRADVSNSMVHPALQCRSIDSRVLAGKWGKLCACLAAFGRDGRFNSHVWVEVTVSPFGIMTSIGSMAICLFMWGVEVDT